MPIREFKCNECGLEFETLVMRKDEKINCEKCGSGNLDKLLSAFAVHGAHSADNKSSSGSCSSSGSKCGSCGSHKCSTCSN
ncbi:FmdB family transcriptional regulator [Candidatus Desantisbacteria bacterium CG_4_10_14_0_8_um_filter_48_22]|uniref:FmdB family transcriptional regulator n=1 Tax=Candidatus Desantisbacteria bacterium CG_4_10_14_0_8_um_filter_48_22 TaxID=1974543 RepID=A0A2M7SEF2_9BACT|nr:MAG: hypothetical protein AUJ67_02600 [Candidatus Desantisbacteria bacterium CG1_02_49_89]PIV55720.1 MAG: FmdB family transcriptional regulator [Candidatus Desantisbacteria bacterium CG02_land_8_20_14_3_00_49_13]PIZ17864.1 MAG: FmdB family transcriptional regulator [Candidatus Desantisbacteria bacterium CG_4_10_14_0_8_um_filter_48_22]PJB27802.1 MAG: FmdB family transcriptional regulator [Candidatus Desantisbacteria bacterium CG_4_9_14_3_um_filter_50_7]